MKLLDLLRRLLGGVRPLTAQAAPVPTAHPLDETEDEEAYRAALADVLDKRTDAAARTLRAALAELPENAREIMVIVHPTQDAEGPFTVMLHLGGPDLFVLQKAIEPHRVLFKSRQLTLEGEGRLPLFSDFDHAFSVNDAIVDVAADWAAKVWDRAGAEKVAIPARVFGEDGYGTTTPRDLPTREAP